MTALLTRASPQTLRLLALGLALLATILFFATQIEGYLSPRMFTRISTSAAVVLPIAVGQAIVIMTRNIDLSAAEIQLVNEVGREQTLGRALHPVIDRYDYILVDCQPSLGLLTVNALACADGVIIPMECEYFSLRGLALLNDTVDKVRDRLNYRLALTGIVVTMYDPRTLHSREVMARVVEVFGDLVFDTVINRTVRFPETSVAGEPITSWAPRSGGAQAYRALAREVIYRIGR